MTHLYRLVYTTNCCQQQANDIIPNEENEMNSKKIKVKTSPEPMSMREFSRLIRRSPSHISRVLSGKRASLTISRLMKTLGVEVA